MSGFEGRMKEYRQISLDKFDKTNLHSTVFFLSHCHRDHMVGLDTLSFLQCLKSRDGVFLFCSEVTKLLLLSEKPFKPLAPYIRVLEVGVASTVTIPDADVKEYKSVTVTALPAGHCPGSVMFLIEGKEGRVLYTGDFRWEKNYATTLPALCVNGHLKEVDSMYVDTTFCVPEAFYIPSRDDCLEATASLVVAWLRQSPRRFLHISSRTKYGHEPLLAHLAKEAQTQVHVCKQKADLYEQISELQGVFTSDCSARIHACNWQSERVGDSRLPCGFDPTTTTTSGADNSSSDPVEVMVVRPSTMWFTAEPSRLRELVVKPASGRGLHRACYSFHSSYSEIRDLVSLLRPRHVHPNVLPASDSQWSQVRERLQRFLRYQHQYHLAPAGDGVPAKPLGLLKRKRTESHHSLTDSEGLVFDSPVEVKKSKQEASQDADSKPSSQTSVSCSVISPAKSEAHSSYRGSDSDGDMFADSDNEETTPPGKQQTTRCGAEGDGATVNPPGEGSQSLMSYVSGDEEVPEEDQMSSPQFRHLTSRDDLEVESQTGDDEVEEGDSALCAKQDELHSGTVSGDGADDVGPTTMELKPPAEGDSVVDPAPPPLSEETSEEPGGALKSAEPPLGSSSPKHDLMKHERQASGKQTDHLQDKKVDEEFGSSSSRQTNLQDKKVDEEFGSSSSRRQIEAEVSAESERQNASGGECPASGLQIGPTSDISTISDGGGDGDVKVEKLRVGESATQSKLAADKTEKLSATVNCVDESNAEVGGAEKTDVSANNEETKAEAGKSVSSLGEETKAEAGKSVSSLGEETKAEAGKSASTLGEETKAEAGKSASSLGEETMAEAGKSASSLGEETKAEAGKSASSLGEETKAEAGKSASSLGEETMAEAGKSASSLGEETKAEAGKSVSSLGEETKAEAGKSASSLGEERMAEAGKSVSKLGEVTKAETGKCASSLGEERMADAGKSASKLGEVTKAETGKCASSLDEEGLVEKRSPGGSNMDVTACADMKTEAMPESESKKAASLVQDLKTECTDVKTEEVLQGESVNSASLVRDSKTDCTAMKTEAVSESESLDSASLVRDSKTDCTDIKTEELPEGESVNSDSLVQDSKTDCTAMKTGEITGGQSVELVQNSLIDAKPSGNADGADRKTNVSSCSKESGVNAGPYNSRGTDGARQDAAHQASYSREGDSSTGQKRKASDSEPETNVISSDSDDDCKITKSYIRRRGGLPGHPGGFPRMPSQSHTCPVHNRYDSGRGHSTLHRAYHQTDTIHKARASGTSSPSKGKDAVSPACATEKKREPADRLFSRDVGGKQPATKPLIQYKLSLLETSDDSDMDIETDDSDVEDGLRDGRGAVEGKSTTRHHGSGCMKGLGESGSKKGLGESGSKKGLGESGSKKGLGESGSKKGHGESGSKKGLGESGSKKGLGESGSKKGLGESGSEKGLAESGSKKGLGESGSKKGLGETGSKKKLGESGSKLASDDSSMDIETDDSDVEDDLRDGHGTVEGKSTTRHHGPGCMKGLGESRSEKGHGESGSKKSLGESGSKTGFSGSGSKKGLGESASQKSFGESGSKKGYGESAFKKGLGESGPTKGLDEPGSGSPWPDVIVIDDGDSSRPSSADSGRSGRDTDAPSSRGSVPSLTSMPVSARNKHRCPVHSPVKETAVNHVSKFPAKGTGTKVDQEAAHSSSKQQQQRTVSRSDINRDRHKLGRGVEGKAHRGVSPAKEVSDVIDLDDGTDGDSSDGTQSKRRTSPTSPSSSSIGAGKARVADGSVVSALHPDTAQSQSKVGADKESSRHAVGDPPKKKPVQYQLFLLETTADSSLDDDVIATDGADVEEKISPCQEQEPQGCVDSPATSSSLAETPTPSKLPENSSEEKSEGKEKRRAEESEESQEVEEKNGREETPHISTQKEIIIEENSKGSNSNSKPEERTKVYVSDGEQEGITEHKEGEKREMERGEFGDEDKQEKGEDKQEKGKRESGDEDKREKREDKHGKGEDKQEMGEDKQEKGEDKHEKGEDKQEMREDKHEKGEDKQEMREDKHEKGEDKGKKGADKKGEDKQEKGEDKHEKGEEKHEKGEEKHEKGEEKHEKGENKKENGEDKHEMGEDKHEMGEDKHEKGEDKCKKGEEKGEDKHEMGEDKHEKGEDKCKKGEDKQEKGDDKCEKGKQQYEDETKQGKGKREYGDVDGQEKGTGEYEDEDGHKKGKRMKCDTDKNQKVRGENGDEDKRGEYGKADKRTKGRGEYGDEDRQREGKREYGDENTRGEYSNRDKLQKRRREYGNEDRHQKSRGQNGDEDGHWKGRRGEYSDGDTSRKGRRGEYSDGDTSHEGSREYDDHSKGKASAAAGRHKPRGEDWDSDSTQPPDSQNSTLPPSPVAIHSSDSDSDVDCKITKSFLKSPTKHTTPLSLHHHCSPAKHTTPSSVHHHCSPAKHTTPSSRHHHCNVHNRATRRPSPGGEGNHAHHHHESGRSHHGAAVQHCSPQKPRQPPPHGGPAASSLPGPSGPMVSGQSENGQRSLSVGPPLHPPVCAADTGHKAKKNSFIDLTEEDD